MVLNKRNLERAFSPSKTRKRRSVLPNRDAKNSANMRVVVRIRPENTKEFQRGSRSIIKIVEENTLIFDPKEEREAFLYRGVQQLRQHLLKKQNNEMMCIFDKVFDSSSTNQEVFDGSTKDMIASLLDGYNCSVFAYGATGAGKTYTMLGNKECPGITYLLLSEFHRQIDELREERDFELGVSHLEVYNENVQDLIQPSGPLHLREDGNGGVIVAGLSVHHIQNAEELLALLERGNRNRTQHPTDANANSSRSHAVFQVSIHMTSKYSEETKIVKLSMIDLAGSEGAAVTGCKGKHFTEGANINRSLLALGNCINCLVDGSKHIPYRDSKLTRLLKDSLGGNCRTVMIANVSPSSLSYEDTWNTLKYALRAKKIKSTLKKNIVPVQLHGAHNAKLVQELSAELESLKEKLKQQEKKLKEYESNNGSSEVKPSTSRIMEPPAPKVPEKCNEFLNHFKRVELNIGLTNSRQLKMRKRAGSTPPESAKVICNKENFLVFAKPKLPSTSKNSMPARLRKQSPAVHLSSLKLPLKNVQNIPKSHIPIRVNHVPGSPRRTLQMPYKHGLTNSRQLKMKKRAGSTPPESAKVICNKENFLVFAKPKLPSTSRNSMPARLRKQSPAVHLSSLKLPLKNVQNIPKSHIPIRVNHVPGSPRRTLQMPYKHGLTNSRQLKMKKRAGSTPPESAKVICNKENFLVFAKPKLPSTSRNSMPARLRKQSPAVHLSSLKLPLKNVQNIPKSHIPIRVNHVPGSPRRTLQMPYKHGLTNSRQLKMKKRAGSTPPESAKVICNKENFLVFAKPKLPSTSRNSMPARLRKQSPAVHLSSLKLPLKNVQNIPKSHIPIRVNHVPGSPRRTLQMPYKHDCRKMPADRRRSQSLRIETIFNSNQV